MFHVRFYDSGRLLEWLRKYQFHFGVAGILLYNNWLLALVLNPHATLAGATTSELVVNGQPSAIVFRIADILAGLLLLLGIGSIVSSAHNQKQKFVLKFAMLVLGLSTIVEVFIPLDCLPALSSLCAQKERVGLLSWQHSFHIIESLVVYSLMFLLPLTAVRALRSQPKARRLVNLSWALMAIMVLWAVETAIRFTLHGESYGYEQRLFIVAFSIWFISVIQFNKKET